MVVTAALDGVRVIELAQWLAGPFAGSILADFGADVIKVERPGTGDEARTLGGVQPEDPSRSPWWITFSRNKRSLTLDPSTPAGREVLLDLVRQSDVLIESFRPGTLERWDLGWDILSRANPGLVLLRVSGFGQEGPWRDRPGFDRVLQAFSGLMYLTGDPDGAPARAGVSITDYGSGVWGALGVMLALRARDADEEGRGQVIDHALYDTLLPWLGDVPFDYVRHRQIRERSGSRHPKVAPGGAYRTGDGVWTMVSCTSQASFERLARAIGIDDVLGDARFATNAERVVHRTELDARIEAALDQLTQVELAELLTRHEVPHSPIHRIDQLMEHEHVRARGDFVSIEDPVLGSIPTAAPRPRLVSTPGTIRTTAPRVGEHTREVLGDLLGYDDARTASLARDGVI